MTTMKLNWGTRITLLYGGFVALIVTLVTMSMKQDFQLVSKDYYQQEIKFQEVIDAGKNLAALSQPVSLEKRMQRIHLRFPKEFRNQAISGTITFYAASNAGWDRQFPIGLEHDAMDIPLSQLKPTSYQVKLNWVASGKRYYQETTLNLYH